MHTLSVFQSKLGNQNKFEGIKTGWTVKIFQKIKEGEKTRVQAFEGMVISLKHGTEAGGTITLRKVSDGIGVEKTFPVYLPSIDKVEVLRKTKSQRAKLYYLRDKTAKEIRKKIKTQQQQAALKKEEVSEDTQ